MFEYDAGNGKIMVSEGIKKKILQNNVLLLKITLEQGPCTDNMCQLIKNHHMK